MSEPEELERKTRRAKDRERRQQQKDDFANVMATPQGRRLLWRLIDGTGFEAASYVGEAMGTAYNEGRRSVGIALKTEASRVAPRLYAIMRAEALQAEQLEAEAVPEPKDPAVD